MDEWWLSLNTLDRIFWITGLSGSLIFAVQMILTFSGAHLGDHDMAEELGNADINNLNNKGKTSSFLTIRNVIVFLAVFGWAGIATSKENFSPILSIFIATLSGGLAMLGVTYLLRKILNLAIDQTVRTKDAINKIGEVYIPIPGNETGTGKVNIEIKGTLCELSAKSMHALSVGTKIIVIDILEDNVLLVDEWKSEDE